MGSYSFGKNEKLCSRSAINELFRTGKSFKELPVRVVRLQLEKSDATAKVLISVPKKKFRKAVSRNRIKRQIREVYRLNKSELIEIWQQDGKYFALAFVYIGNELPVYKELNTVMKQILEKLKSV